MTGTQHIYAVNQRLIPIVTDPVQEICRQISAVKSSGLRLILTQLLELRAEEKPAALPGIVKGLCPQSVPGAEQFVFAPIPQCKSPHPIEVGQTVLSPLAIGVKQYFRVTGGMKTVAQ